MTTARKSRIHGKGCFADREFAVGEVVAFYEGEEINADEMQLRCSQGKAHFICWLSDTRFVDGSKSQNAIRYINHARSPNVSESIVGRGRNRKIVFRACRPINRGQEVTLFYGVEFDEALRNGVSRRALGEGRY